MSMNGECIVSGDVCGTVRMWGRKDGEWEGTSIIGHNCRVDRVTMTSNTIVSWSGHNATLRLADQYVEDWKRRGIHGDSSVVNSAAGSRDGRLVVSCGMDGNVLLWDVREGVCYWTELGKHVGVLWCVAIGHNGLWVASASGDKTLLV